MPSINTKQVSLYLPPEQIKYLGSDRSKKVQELVSYEMQLPADTVSISVTRDEIEVLIEALENQGKNREYSQKQAITARRLAEHFRKHMEIK